MSEQTARPHGAGVTDADYGTTSDECGAVGYAGVPQSADPGDSAASTKDQAAGAAKEVARTAKDEAATVIDTTKEQASQVAGEARDQARQLWRQSRQELMDQSSQQQQRVAGSLRTLADDLSSMARSSERSGLANDVVREVSEHAADAAAWLEHRDPGSLLTEVRQFARQRPGAFLAIAAGVGVLGGRLTRAMVDESRDDGPPSGDAPPESSDGAPVDRSDTGYRASGSPSDAGRSTPPGPVTSQGDGADPLLSVDPQTGLTRTYRDQGTDEYSLQEPR